MKKGFLSLVLHAHLPYVRHPEHERFFEENWLFEAITECYIPLINILDDLHRDNVDFRITLSVSPTLMTMLNDDLLQKRYQRHLDKQIELSEKEIDRTRHNQDLNRLARLYRRFFINIQKTYFHYQGDLLSAFKQHYLNGQLELITTAATHGFLPLLNLNQSTIHNQIKMGLETFNSYFGFNPEGMWLPECGFYPGLEQYLAENGVKYFFTDTHGLMHASEHPENGVYAPVDCGNGVMAFARDPDSSEQVWSAESGYPGNADYREYHSDIGFDLEMDYVAPYILDTGDRINTGIKYHSITAEGQEKRIYQPDKANWTVTRDAVDFVSRTQKHIAGLAETMDRSAIIVAPYDAELFGHWWFEGPAWLESVIRLADDSTVNFEIVSCADYLTKQTSHQISMPASSTWGGDGYSSYWISEENEWIYPFLHKAADQMEQLANDFKKVQVTDMQVRVLNQAARSLLLAQASDWPFIMKSGTTTEYARKRITDHLARFNYLHSSIRTNKIDQRYLLALELMDNIFPNIDYRDFQS